MLCAPDSAAWNCEARCQKHSSPWHEKCDWESRACSSCVQCLWVHQHASAETDASSPPCMSSSPRLCGPILHPSTVSPLLAQTGLLSGGPRLDALEFIHHPSRPDLPGVVFCGTPKAGTTSLYHWLFELLAGREWPYHGSPWVQSTTSTRWTTNMPYRVQSLNSMPLSRTLALLRNSTIPKVALIRDPIQRAVSAFYSKATCPVYSNGHLLNTDYRDHEKMLQSLTRCAPGVQSRFANGDACCSRDKACMNALEWSNAMLAASRSSFRYYHAPPNDCAAGGHFDLQVEFCGLEHIGYDVLIPVEDQSAGLRTICRSLGKTCIPPRHGHTTTTSSLKPQMPGVVLDRLAQAFANEVETLNYPPNACETMYSGASCMNFAVPPPPPSPPPSPSPA